MKQRHWLLLGLAGLFLALQCRLWLGSGGILARHRLWQAVSHSSQQNQAMQARNAALQAEVADLGKGGQAIEARARTELGMIRQGETFYLVVRRD